MPTVARANSANGGNTIYWCLWQCTWVEWQNCRDHSLYQGGGFSLICLLLLPVLECVCIIYWQVNSVISTLDYKTGTPWMGRMDHQIYRTTPPDSIFPARNSIIAQYLLLRGWGGWTTKSIELHLQTQFSQLETASLLNIYYSVDGEDGPPNLSNYTSRLDFPSSKQHHRSISTHNLFVAWKTFTAWCESGVACPKSLSHGHVLQKTHWYVLGFQNLPFRAFAWYKYYMLYREYNRSMSCALLAAFCIPTLESGAVVQISESNMSQKGNGITTVKDEIAS